MIGHIEALMTMACAVDPSGTARAASATARTPSTTSRNCTVKKAGPKADVKVGTLDSSPGVTADLCRREPERKVVPAPADFTPQHLMIAAGRRHMAAMPQHDPFPPRRDPRALERSHRAWVRYGR